MLCQAMVALQDFHEAKDVAYTCRLDGTPIPHEDCIVIDTMKEESEFCLEEFKARQDPRWLRVHLILEETAELVEAIFDGDEVKALDGMCDAIYVIVGSAVSFDLPLSEGFEEVHRSNMSKAGRSRQTDSCPRLSDKGDSYSPPDLSRIICEYREEQAHGQHV